MKKNFIGVIVSLVFIGILAYSMRAEVPRVLSVLRNGNHALLLAATLIFLTAGVIMGLRLKLIFSGKDILIPLRETVSLTFVGFFFNNFLPTSAGGDIVKAICAARITKEPVKCVSAVMMDRIFGLFMFILIPCASLFFLRDKINPKVPVIVYSFLGMSIIFFVLIFNSSIAKRFHLVEKFLNVFKVGGFIRRIYDELHDFKNHKGLVALAMILSLAGQSVSIFVLYLMALALGADPSSWLYFFLLVPIVHLIGMVPLTLNGLGPREAAYIYFLKNYIGVERATAVGILWFGLLMVCSIIGGLIYLARHDYHIRFNKPNREEVTAL